MAIQLRWHCDTRQGWYYYETIASSIFHEPRQCSAEPALDPNCKHIHVNTLFLIADVNKARHISDES